jgi:predicted Zn-dependent peptidase
MEGVYYQQQLDKGINLYLINDPKFKTVSVSLFLYRQLDQNTTKNALLPYILKRGNQDYTDLRAIEKFLGERYGASLNVDVLKKGDLQLLYFNSSVISNKYTLKGEGVVEDILNFLLGLISKPLIDDSGFKEEYFNQEKENLGNLIASRINDKIQYSLERCYEEMCKGQPFSRYKYGSMEELKTITPSELAEYYHRMISEVPIDVFVVGDVDIPDLQGVQNDRLGIERREIVYPVQEIYEYNGNTSREIIERMDVTQGKLTMGYTTGVNYTHPEYVPMLVYASVLGGGAHSKLFNNVREKASLAYYSFARLEKFKGLMAIGSGIEISNYEKAVSIIDEQLKDIREGRIEDYELEGAKKALINDILSMKDSQAQMVDFLINRIISGHRMTPESLIKSIKTVSLEQVSEVSHKVKPVITYFLTSTGEDGREDK